MCFYGLAVKRPSTFDEDRAWPVRERPAGNYPVLEYRNISAASAYIILP